jgi:hypothetical protein
MKKISFLLCLVFLNGCYSENAFRPGPPAFKGWVRDATSEEDVKQEMLNCGYQNPYTPNRNDTMNDRAIKEICMFNKGFIRKNEIGFKGICYSSNWHDKPACVEYRREHPTPPN